MSLLRGKDIKGLHHILNSSKYFFFLSLSDQKRTLAKKSFPGTCSTYSLSLYLYYTNCHYETPVKYIIKFGELEMRVNTTHVNYLSFKNTNPITLMASSY